MIWKNFSAQPYVLLSPLDGGRKLQPGQIAKCESVIDCSVTAGRKYAILRWEQIDVGTCRVGVDVRDVRRIEI